MMDIPNRICPKCNGQQIVFDHAGRISQCDLCEGRGCVTEKVQAEWFAEKAKEAAHE